MPFIAALGRALVGAQIARHLHIGRRTLAKYLETPAPRTATRQRAASWTRLSQHRRMAHPGPDRQRRGDRATAPSARVDGGMSILKEHLHAARARSRPSVPTYAWNGGRGTL